MPKKKKKNVFQPKKRLRFRKSYRRRRPRPLTVSPNISSQTYETEELYYNQGPKRSTYLGLIPVTFFWYRVKNVDIIVVATPNVFVMVFLSTAVPRLPSDRSYRRTSEVGHSLTSRNIAVKFTCHCD